MPKVGASCSFQTLVVTCPVIVLPADLMYVFFFFSTWGVVVDRNYTFSVCLDTLCQLIITAAPKHSLPC